MYQYQKEAPRRPRVTIGVYVALFVRTSRKAWQPVTANIDSDISVARNVFLKMKWVAIARRVILA